MVEEKKTEHELVKFGKNMKMFFKDEATGFFDFKNPKILDRNEASLFVNKVFTEQGEFLSFELTYDDVKIQGVLDEKKTDAEKEILDKHMRQARAEMQKLKQQK